MTIESVMLHAESDGDEPFVNITHYDFPMHASVHAEINITYISVAGSWLDVDDVHVEFSKIWAAGVRIVDYTLVIPDRDHTFRFIPVITPKLWSETSINCPLFCNGVTFALVAKSCEVYARGTISSL
jgi:hypothetical protein